MKNAEPFEAWILRTIFSPYFKFAMNTAKAMIMPDIPVVETMEVPKVKIQY